MLNPNPSESTHVWSQRLDRFLGADMTVAQFCQAEGVSQASYYYWRRKLRSQSKPTSQNTRSITVAKPQSTFLPVALAAKPDDPSVNPAAAMTIELPGGICVRLEVPVERRGDES